MTKKELTPSEYEEIVAAKGSKKSVNANYAKYSIIALIALVLCGISFAAGIEYQKDKSPATRVANGSGSPSFENGPGGFGTGGGFMRSGQRPNIGEVTTVSSDSIAIQSARTNSNQTFKITSTTNVENGGSKAAVTDIKKGDTVMVITDTSDTSTASQIMINPSFRTGGPSTNSSQESL